jgi:hypothetical protein
MLFYKLRAELLIIGSGGIVDDIVPPDRLGQNFAIGRRQIVETGKQVETILDVAEIVIVTVRRRVGGNEIIVGHSR